MAKTNKRPETMNEVEYKLFDAEAKVKYSLARFGDHLARKHKYRADLSGLDAVRYYLMQKHHWAPAILLNMSIDDMRFAVSEEMHGWTMRPEDLPGD